MPPDDGTPVESFACRICGNTGGNRAFRVREMMFGFRDAFDYVECGECGCLQIREVPANLSRYYPDEYHSLQDQAVVRDNPLVAFLKRQRAGYCLGGRNPLGWAVSRAFGIPEYYQWFRKGKLRLDYKVLDVGAGTGRLLFAMRREGFTCLTGVEPFIPEDLAYPNGIRVLKKELRELDGQYDFALLHHSFEHMPNPRETLLELHRLLRPDRFVFIRLPVAGCFAWRHYRANWVDLDAPRHLFLPTVKSMKLLAEQTGFRLADVEFDSTEFQFWASEQYARDIPLKSFQNTLCTDEEIKAFKRRAEELNRKGDGDQACFYLHRP
jgi:SAM-dependent methyltransferase